jgi:hypothetical protein
MSRLPLVGFALAIGALAWLFYGSGDDAIPPTPCTCRELADHPTAYAGKVVRVSTAGVQVEGKSLVWRHASHLPPAVVLRFEGKAPDPVPAHLVGSCRGPLPGGPVVVANCRP